LIFDFFVVGEEEVQQKVKRRDRIETLSYLTIANIEGLLAGGGAGGRQRRTFGTRTSRSSVEVDGDCESAAAAAAIPTSFSSGHSSHRTSSSTPKGGTMARRRLIVECSIDNRGLRQWRDSRISFLY